MTPTLPTDLISASKVLEWMENNQFCEAARWVVSFSDLRDEIQSGRFAPAVHSADGLLPCPFCGGEPDVDVRKDESLWNHNIVDWTEVKCSQCNFNIETCEGVSEAETAIAIWNTRHQGAGWMPISKDHRPEKNKNVLLGYIEGEVIHRAEKGYWTGTPGIYSVGFPVTHYTALPTAPGQEGAG